MNRTGVAITLLWRNQKYVLGVDADADVLERLSLAKSPAGKWLSLYGEPCLYWPDEEDALRGILAITGKDTRLDSELYRRYPWLAEEMRG